MPRLVEVCLVVLVMATVRVFRSKADEVARVFELTILIVNLSAMERAVREVDTSGYNEGKNA